MDSGGSGSLRRLALLLVLLPRGDQTQAGLRPEARQAQVGRLPGEAGPGLHRRAHRVGRMVRRQTAIYQVLLLMSLS